MTRLNSICAALLLFLSAPIGLAQIQSPTTAPAPPGVVIYPFNAIGEPGRFNWVGQGIQQSLMVDASRRGVNLLNTPTTAPDGAQTDPVGAAGRAGASVVVVGSYQIVNDQIRVTGQALQTLNGQPLGILSATGPINNLFRIEDALGAQLQQELPGTNPAPASATAATAAASPLTGPAEAYQPETNGGYVYTPPVDVTPAPNYSYAAAPDASYYSPTYYPDSYYYGGYPYSYSYGGYYPYWGWGGGFVIINGGGRDRDRDRDHGRGRDGSRDGHDRNGFHDFGHGDFGIGGGGTRGGFNRGPAIGNIGGTRGAIGGGGFRPMGANGFGAGRNQAFSPGARAFGGGMGGGMRGGGGGHR